MATRRYIADLRPGDTVEDEVFVVSRKELRQSQTGSKFISLTVSDKTAKISAKIWQATDGMYKTIPQTGYLRLKGRIDEYRGELQMIIEAIRPVDPTSVNLADLVPCTSKDVEAMWKRAIEILRTIKSKEILILLKQFIGDPEFAAGFKRAPAAVSYHHAYIGGLLEHTLNLLETAAAILPLYPQVNADLVLAGLFLHDTGKIRELSSGAAFEYTDEGQLVGHVVQAAIWIEQKAAEAEKESGRFPADVKWVLQHIVLSHHGTYEFGSARLPATPEASMVHSLDQMDSKIYEFCAAIHDCTDESSSWTEWVRPLNTRVYRGVTPSARADSTRPTTPPSAPAAR
jgi:3'-5' exoribonuclease